MRPKTTAECATLRIGVPAGGKVWIDQVSLMSDAARRTGGSFTCWYRWKDDDGPLRPDLHQW